MGKIYVKGQHLIQDGPKQGMLMDYGDIKKYIQPLLDDYLDHYFLNETTGLINPTSEEIAKWIFEQLEAAGLPNLYAVEIQETCTSGCRYMKSKVSE